MMRFLGVILIGLAVACSGGSTNPSPTLVVHEPSANGTLAVGSNVQIVYADDDPKGVATSDVFADADGNPDTVGDQIPIANDRPQGGGANQTVDWDTAGVAAGNWTILVRTDDGVNTPVVRAAVGIITLFAATPPTASIHFPLPGSSTNQPTITVSGTAADPDGVAAVTVNGIPATTADEFQSWQAVVPLTLGANTLNVDARDNLGSVGSPAASSQVIRTARASLSFEPRSPVLDATHAYYINGLVIERMDLANGLRETVLEPGRQAISLALAESIGALYMILERDPLWREIIALDLATGATSLVASESDPSVGALDVLVWNPVTGDLITAGGYQAITFTSVDPATGVGTQIFSGYPAGEFIAYLTSIALDIKPPSRNRIVWSGVRLSGFVEQLYQTDLSTGSTGGLLSSSGAVSIAAGSDTAYIGWTTHIDRFDLATNTLGPPLLDGTFGPIAVDPTDTLFFAQGSTAAEPDSDALRITLPDGTASPLFDTLHDRGTGVALRSPTDVCYDAANDRLLVTDDDYAGIVAIDVSSGDRTTLVDNSSGGGVDFESPQALVLDSARNRLLVADTNRMQIVEVDLTTLERSDFSPGPPLAGTDGINIAIHPDSNRLFVPAPNIPAIVEIDLDTGVGSPSAVNPAVGVLLTDALSIVAPDIGRDRILFMQLRHPTVFGADLTTLERASVSGPFVGNGPQMGDPRSRDMELHPDERRLVVVGPEVSGLSATHSGCFLVDVVNGDREALLSLAEDANEGTDGPPYFPIVTGVALDASRNVAFIVEAGDTPGVHAIDLVSKEWVLISR